MSDAFKVKRRSLARKTKKEPQKKRGVKNDNHSHPSGIRIKRLYLQQQQILQLLTQYAKQEISFVVSAEKQASIINYHHNHGGESLRGFSGLSLLYRLDSFRMFVDETFNPSRQWKELHNRNAEHTLN